LFILMLLDESPRHGYDLIRLIEDRFLGMYTPSAGTVYPRLQSLEDEGLIEHDELDGKKVYRLTDAGRAELESRRSELEELQERATETARKVVGAIGGDMRESVRDLRDELRHAMRDVRREDRFASRSGRRPRPWAEGPGGGSAGAPGEVFSRRGRGGGADPGGSGLGQRILRDDLAAFASDITARAAGVELDRATLAMVRDRLMEAQDAVAAVLSSSGGPAADPEGVTEA
ncbi:MAG: PadR family transcriptional regulator, partial [Acidimicrobiales bacterium]